MRGTNKNHAKEKEMKEGQVAVWKGSKNSWGKKRNKKQGRKGKIYTIECRVTQNNKERQDYLK